ncbi:MAG: hypothetical protein ABIH25_05740 [Candidatus Woesearchaeota archaeon]
MSKTRLFESFDSLKKLIEKEEEVKEVKAIHRIHQDSPTPYFETICTYYAISNFNDTIGQYSEITKTNAPKMITKPGKVSQTEYVVRKVFLTDYVTISENLESLPEKVDIILLSQGRNLPINSKLYKQKLEEIN